jgi:hypothetical protein
VVQTFAGVASGTFTAPDHEYPSYLELELTATDAGGLTDRQTLRLDPRTVTLSLASNPGGLLLGFDGTQATAPFSRTVIEHSVNSVSAPNQTKNKNSWAFSSWSDGGAATHNLAPADVNATYTASFKKAR